MRRILQVFYATFSAIIFSLAIPNEFITFGSPFLGLFALVPLYLALRNAKTYREAAFLTGWQVFCVHLLSSFWLGFFRDFAIFTLGASALGTGAIGMAFGCFLYFPFAHSRIENRFFYDSTGLGVFTRTLFFAAIWTLYEWGKSFGFLGYPWGTIIMSSYKWPLITQIVSITGTWGISFLFAFFSAIIAEGFCLITEIHRKDKASVFNAYSRCGAICILFFLIVCVYGTFEYTKERIPIKNMETVIVQQNLDPWEGTDSQVISISTRLSTQGINEAIKATGEKPDLVVWSEAVLARAFPSALDYYMYNPDEQPLIPFIQECQVPFVIGAPVRKETPTGRGYLNAALYFDKNAEYQGYYAKMHLVPFAEVVPGLEFEWIRNLLSKVIGISSGWLCGTEINLFDVPLNSGESVKISLPICFEDAFSSVCSKLYKAGSEVFVNLTNDSWSLTKSAEYQHFVISSFRAIEFRTTLLRATNSGYSVVVDPAGKILADLPLFQEAVLTTSVPIYERQKTVYSILGDWVPLLCVISFILFAIITQFNQKRQK